MTNVAITGPAIAPSVLAARRRPIAGPAVSRPCAPAISMTSGNAVPRAMVAGSMVATARPSSRQSAPYPLSAETYTRPSVKAAKKRGEATTSRPAMHHAVPSRAFGGRSRASSLRARAAPMVRPVMKTKRTTAKE